MNLLSVARQSFDSIKANKLKSSLTLLAIAVGVFAVISANTAVLVLDTYFNNTLNVMGGNVITISKDPVIRTGNDWGKYRNRKDITFAQMDDIIDRVRNVSDVGPVEDFSFTSVSFDNKETEPNVRIRGGNMHYLTNNSFDLEEGRNFTDLDINNARDVVIIGAEIRETLFETVDPLLKTIRIDGRPYTVIGVTEAKGAIFGNSQDRFVVAPYTSMLNNYGGRQRNIAIQVTSASVAGIEDAIDELTGILRLIRKVAPGDPNDFEISTNDTLGGAFDQFTGVLYIIGFVVGGIALLGAGIGVMNIMLVSVTERTREIGVRKAVGAPKSAITSQFLMEAIVICQIGGLVGLFAGVLVGNLLSLQLDTTAVFPWAAALLGIVAMTFVGLIFGVYPAFKAASLDPIDALRYE